MKYAVVLFTLTVFVISTCSSGAAVYLGSRGTTHSTRIETTIRAMSPEELEQRFIALYEAVMEKQISFKDAVEPFKTDNQNAGKGR